MNPDHRSFDQMAEIAIAIYKSEFRGKKKGRYTLTREDIKRISGRSSLHPSIIAGFAAKMLENEYCVMDVDGGDIYSVVSQSIHMNHRRVTKKVLEDAISDSDDDWG
ncbi:hypothetical protein ACF8LF_08040 [Pseudomonas putida]|uniref:hypothetical protein n=1 Tax=Pseudomonas putida TaxID=303 RepID=UPI00370AD502